MIIQRIMDIDNFDDLYKEANEFFEENSYKLVSNFWDEFDEENISGNGLLILMSQEESSENSIELYN